MRTQNENVQKKGRKKRRETAMKFQTLKKPFRKPTK